MPRTKKVFILLIRYPGFFADAMVNYFQFGYTHVTIGLEEDMNTFYSFMRKGFVEEKVTRYLKPGREPFPCALYELSVSRKTYRRVKQLLNSYIARKKFLRYTHFTLVFAFLGIPWKLHNRYFCSQFVAEVLQRSRAAFIPKNSAKCFARDFDRLPETRKVFTGDLLGLARHYHLA